MEKYLGQDVPKLGFGFMRLPTLKGNEIDIQTVNQMVDAFIAAGFTYFDAAYGYMEGRSEETIRRTVVERYARDQFLLATKLPTWELKAEGDAERLFDTQLKRTNAGYFDYYLIHAVSGERIKILDDLDIWSFIREKKEKGLVKHIGISFHDTADVLDRVLTAHPELEFVQLQINYIDWEDKNIQSKLCYETAIRHNVSVIIMEPVKGGALAVLSNDARALLAAARPNESPASWAIRYCASLDRVITVLSGMSTMEQVADNIQTMTSFDPFTEGDQRVIEQVKNEIAKIPTIPCTNCKYCTEKCPSGIAIPGILGTENSRRLYGHTDIGHYRFVTGGKGKASDCIACGVCEGRCPQHLSIIELLRGCAQVFEDLT